MTNLSGFVKLHRKMIEWGWYSDSVVKDVFLHLLMVAAWKEGRYLGHEIKPGQAIVGRKKMAQELGFSERQVRTALDKLESTGEIARKTTNKFTIVTIENWEFYQSDNNNSDQQVTSKRPTNDQQMTNKGPHLKKVKKDKKVKKEREYARAYGFFQNVFLSDEEYLRFTNKYENAVDIIESLSNYKERKGKNNDNNADYAWIESFAKTDGKQKATPQNIYTRYLNEAKAGFPPPSGAELTKKQFQELIRIAEEAIANEAEKTEARKI